MHVCSIITSYTAGGAEVLAANLSAAFVEAGHRSTMLALCDAAAIGNPLDYEAAFKQRVSDAGSEALSLRLTNRRNVLTGALAMRRVIRDMEPDIIHVHTAQALLLLLFAGVRRPVVYTHHNIRCNFPLWLFRAFDRITGSYIAIGDACRSLLEGAVRRPVILIRNGVPAAFSRATPRKAPRRDPVLLSAGALTPQKDYATLIRAAAIVVREMASHDRHPRFRIAGDGTEMEALRALIDELGLGANIELLGTRRDVPELMRESDLMVNSSLFEGLPIALIEAAMSALPVVATDVGGSGEIVAPDVNGLLVPPGDPKALARAILAILRDEDRYAAMSKASAERSRAFSLESCARAHMKLYAKLCLSPSRVDIPQKAGFRILSDRHVRRKISRGI